MKLLEPEFMFPMYLLECLTNGIICVTVL